jgi:hypothetical protein
MRTLVYTRPNAVHLFVDLHAVMSRDWLFLLLVRDINDIRCASHCSMVDVLRNSGVLRLAAATASLPGLNGVTNTLHADTWPADSAVLGHVSASTAAGRAAADLVPDGHQAVSAAWATRPVPLSVATVAATDGQWALHGGVAKQPLVYAVGHCAAIAGMPVSVVAYASGDLVAEVPGFQAEPTAGSLPTWEMPLARIGRLLGDAVSAMEVTAPPAAVLFVLVAFNVEEHVVDHRTAVVHRLLATCGPPATTVLTVNSNDIAAGANATVKSKRVAATRAIRAGRMAVAKAELGAKRAIATAKAVAAAASVHLVKVVAATAKITTAAVNAAAAAATKPKTARATAADVARTQRATDAAAKVDRAQAAAAAATAAATAASAPRIVFVVNPHVRSTAIFTLASEPTDRFAGRQWDMAVALCFDSGGNRSLVLPPAQVAMTVQLAPRFETGLTATLRHRMRCTTYQALPTPLNPATAFPCTAHTVDRIAAHTAVVHAQWQHVHADTDHVAPLVAAHTAVDVSAAAAAMPDLANIVLTATVAVACDTATVETLHKTHAQWRRDDTGQVVPPMLTPRIITDGAATEDVTAVPVCHVPRIVARGVLAAAHRMFALKTRRYLMATVVARYVRAERPIAPAPDNKGLHPDARAIINVAIERQAETDADGNCMFQCPICLEYVDCAACSSCSHLVCITCRIRMNTMNCRNTCPVCRTATTRWHQADEGFVSMAEDISRLVIFRNAPANCTLVSGTVEPDDLEAAHDAANSVVFRTSQELLKHQVATVLRLFQFSPGMRGAGHLIAHSGQPIRTSKTVDWLDAALNKCGWPSVLRAASVDRVTCPMMHAIRGAVTRQFTRVLSGGAIPADREPDRGDCLVADTMGDAFAAAAHAHLVADPRHLVVLLADSAQMQDVHNGHQDCGALVHLLNHITRHVDKDRCTVCAGGPHVGAAAAVDAACAVPGAGRIVAWSPLVARNILRNSPGILVLLPHTVLPAVNAAHYQAVGNMPPGWAYRVLSADVPGVQTFMHGWARKMYRNIEVQTGS